MIEWNFDKNSVSPHETKFWNCKKNWWKCINNHSWEARISERIRGRGCPYCCGKKVSENNCLSVLFPEISNEWHPTKNNNLQPRDFSFASHKKVWWLCKYGHEWEAVISDRTKSKPTSCPFCNHQRITFDNSLAHKFPELSKEWHPNKNGDLTPDKVNCGSKYKVWWICSICKSNFESHIYHRTSGKGCPFCSGRKVNETNSLLMKFPELSKEWHSIKNGILTPSDFTSKSSKSVWWICNKCNMEWKASICNRTAGRGCPKCSKGSHISKPCSIWLDENKIPDDMDHREVVIKINKKIFKVDGFIPETKTIYEYFGTFWHGHPDYYNPNDINPINKKPFGKLYEETINKIRFLENSGFKVIYKWG